MLDFTHSYWLVTASFAVALMAGFTGLTLTKGANTLPESRRKVVVAMAAVVLGGGIWSMHFVAMLGLQLPILFFYDALITMISALVAILVVGLALLLLHFQKRRPPVILAAGCILGIGIVAMHYIGMAGMQLCRPVYGTWDIVISTFAALFLSTVAIWVAYDARTHRNILLGTVCFGLAVVTMHFVAIGLTEFEATPAENVVGPQMDNQILAMGVTVAVFLICGAFLLTGITYVTEEAAPDTGVGEAAFAPAAPAHPGDVATQDAQDALANQPARAAPEAQDLAPLRAVAPEPQAPKAGVPYEREGQTHFALPETIAALRAEGHYTVLYVAEEKLFCPWSITEAESRLTPAGFLRVHRSYLVNPAHVSSFERRKDNGTCFFDNVSSLPKVPVSRSRMSVVREALGV